MGIAGESKILWRLFSPFPWRINGQMLKLQGQAFGLENRQGKARVEHFNRFNGELERGLGPTAQGGRGYPGGDGLPKF